MCSAHISGGQDEPRTKRLKPSPRFVQEGAVGKKIKALRFSDNQEIWEVLPAVGDDTDEVIVLGILPKNPSGSNGTAAAKTAWIEPPSFSQIDPLIFAQLPPDVQRNLRHLPAHRIEYAKPKPVSRKRVSAAVVPSDVIDLRGTEEEVVSETVTMAIDDLRQEEVEAGFSKEMIEYVRLFSPDASLRSIVPALWQIGSRGTVIDHDDARLTELAQRLLCRLEMFFPHDLESITSTCKSLKRLATENPMWRSAWQDVHDAVQGWARQKCFQLKL